MKLALLLALAAFITPHLPAQLLGNPESYPIPTNLVIGRIATGDLDENGSPDVVVMSPDEINVFLADGLGGFQAAITQPLLFPQFLLALSMQLADSNADGHLDIWVGSSLGLGVRLLLGDGSGNFTIGPGLGGESVMTVGDLNDDGHPDLVTGTGMTVLAAFNDGNGSFGALTPIGQVTGGLFVGELHVADFNNDGVADVMALMLFGGLNVLLGDGAGGYALVSGPSPSAQPGGSVADVNSDRALDYVSVSGGLQVMINDGTGAFSSPVSIAGPSINKGVAVDIDGDGMLDVVGSGTAGVTVFSGDGDGGFVPTANFPESPYRAMTTSDIDGDGRIDVLGLSDTGTEFLVRRNLLPTPDGVSNYGTGTATCAGTIGIWATPRPVLHTPDFRILCSNAPPNQLGMLLLSRHQDPVGSFPSGLGVVLYLSHGIVSRPIRSDAGGAAAASLPIPQIPFLAGGRLYAQSIWFGDAGSGNTCSPAAFELASSRGLSVLLQH